MPSKCNRNEFGSIAWVAMGLSMVIHGILFVGLYEIWRWMPRLWGSGSGVVMIEMKDFDSGAPSGLSPKPTTSKQETLPVSKAGARPLATKSEKNPEASQANTRGEGRGSGNEVGDGGGGSGGGTGNGSGSGGGDGLLSRYVHQVLTQIERKKQYPKLSQENGEEGIVLVDLRIGRSGQLLGYDFRQGHAHPRLVAATKNSIEAAAPFPPLPEYLAQETLNLQVPVRYQLH